MRLVIQRVTSAHVAVNEQITGQISNGLLVLVGITHEDSSVEIIKAANKLVNLRIFNDEQGKMNLSVQDIGGEILVVSQFTLYGEASKKGNRPSFVQAARPERANQLYEEFKTVLKNLGTRVECGIFGADMQVSLVNNGPVTIIMEY